MEWKMESIARNGGGPGTLCWRGGFGVWGIQTVHLHLLHLIISIYILVLAFTIVEGFCFSSSFSCIFFDKKDVI